MPPAERMLWLTLRNKQIKGQKFRRQYSINKFIVDFYCPQVKLAIEIDGESHDDQDRKIYDQQRQKQIENLGIRFLRFSNWQVYENLTGVIEEIVNCLKTSPLPPPW